MNFKKTLTPFLVFASLLTVTASAAAWWERVEAGNSLGCGTGGCTIVEIPVHDTSVNPKGNLSTVNVEAFRSLASTVTAKACRRTWNASSVVCSATQSSGSGTGHASIPLSGALGSFLGAANAGHFGFVSITGTSVSPNQPNFAIINGLFLAD